MTSVSTIPLQSNQISIANQMNELAPMISDKFVLSKNFSSEDDGRPKASLPSIDKLRITDRVPSNVDQINVHTTVIHVDPNKEETKTEPSMDELMELKGNKHLSVEVKLSDLIRYGPLGQGASGFVEKAVHVPTKKIIALKIIPL